jgi:hypothetical protein
MPTPLGPSWRDAEIELAQARIATHQAALAALREASHTVDAVEAVRVAAAAQALDTARKREQAKIDRLEIELRHEHEQVA